MALLSLNVSPDVLIAHARELEDFAETEMNLNLAGRERFWRAAAALRAVAVLAGDYSETHPALFAEVCATVDRMRAQS
jgi:hypothetical protein